MKHTLHDGPERKRRRRRRMPWRLMFYPFYFALLVVGLVVAVKLLIPPETWRVLKETYFNASPEGVLEATGDLPSS